MSFSSRLTRCPIPYDPARGEEACLAGPEQAGAIGDLIRGAGGCSPYLSGLIAREKDWLGGALAAPEATFDTLIQEVGEHPSSRLDVLLRRDKRRVALLIALADLGGVWDLEQVTQGLTRFADAAVSAGVTALVGAEIARGNLPGLTDEDARTGAGMVVLAMGKMGAGELNYSSDIDLICLFDESRYPADFYHEARRIFIRVTRKLYKLLSGITGEGYVFRTDLRLRPDPSVTPVCLSMEAAERYYESVGRTWERAAHIKARPCAGDLVAGARYLARLGPFIWRKHLDFAAIEDAHDMRLRIREHKGFYGDLSLPGHNLKLGRGGIREIEFFTQTRQLISGGRDDSLRDRATQPALVHLEAKGWISHAVAGVLGAQYRALREIEHRVQMINDAQTHDLPRSDAGFERLACLMGRSDTQALRDEMLVRLRTVHDLTEGFFAPSEADLPPPPPPPLSPMAAEIVTKWPAYPALRSSRAVAIFKRLKPEILRRLQRAAAPDDALVEFDRFLMGLPAGVQLFSLFQANPQLIDLILDIVTTAPVLAAHLARNPGLLDSVLDGDFFSEWPGCAALERGLVTRLERVADYEEKLVETRLWQRDWHFRIGVHLLRGLIDAPEAGRQYGDLANATLVALWPAVEADFANRHGAAPGRGAIVLGMGSLGAGRLHAQSDLDLIVIYDAPPDAVSTGRRPLSARPYFARLTQAFVTAISAPMAQGRLYEVDMRLRPSGRQGPVATSWASFVDYQCTQAWTWEHLALTRARPVAGNMQLGADVEGFRARLLQQKGDSATLAGVREMRARLQSAKPGAGVWDAKLGPGHLLDIELLAQTAAFLAGSPARDVAGQLRAGWVLGWFSRADCDRLIQNYRQFWAVQSASKLLSRDTLDPERIGAGARQFLLQICGARAIKPLGATLEQSGRATQAMIETALCRPPPALRKENE